MPRDPANRNPAKEYVNNIIDRLLMGEEKSTLIDFIVEATDPFAVRKMIRHDTPKLYKYLKMQGVLHDFALELSKVAAKPKASVLIKRYEIPKDLVKELNSIL